MSHSMKDLWSELVALGCVFVLGLAVGVNWHRAATVKHGCGCSVNCHCCPGCCCDSDNCPCREKVK